MGSGKAIRRVTMAPGSKVGFEVQASTGVIACGADEVRDSGWARVNSAADIAFVI